MELINLSCVRLWMRDCVLVNWQFKTKKKRSNTQYRTSVNR